MRAETKKKWVEALRSGEYQQTKYTLKHINGGFCCLGVLCEVLGKEWEPDGDYYSVSGKSWEGNTAQFYTQLPVDVLDEIEMSSREQSVLMTMNDTENKSFGEIADYIEQNL